MKRTLLLLAVAAIALTLAWGLVWPPGFLALVLVLPLALLLIRDLTQTRHTILRNYPVFGHTRYILEDFRQHVRQYFIQGDDEGVPFIREQRAAVYQRAKGEHESHPFGTVHDLHKPGAQWFAHSICAREPVHDEHRISIGGPDCRQPYSSARFNISAMSYGSLSGNAIAALNLGAKLGGFSHDTGEGGISRYHREHGGDLVWELGTGYFGCRRADGGFDEAQFADKSQAEQVKMIEVKLSQGAKPGGGGILPGAKVTPEIAEARGVPVGKTVHSPPAHSTFATPTEMLDWLAKLRQLSDGKPIGFKLCIGRPQQFAAIVKAMLVTGIKPDFVSIDGAEGGTGAAPLELSDHLGMPLTDGLVIAHNLLLGAGVRQHIRLIAAGKIIDGFDIAAKIAIGADICNTARGMMFALGCIQARVCDKNVCPTGIATQDPWRSHGLVVANKGPRVARYQRRTIDHLNKTLAAMGIDSLAELRPSDLFQRCDDARVRRYDELYEYLEDGALIDGDARGYQSIWRTATADRF